MHCVARGRESNPMVNRKVDVVTLSEEYTDIMWGAEERLRGSNNAQQRNILLWRPAT